MSRTSSVCKAYLVIFVLSMINGRDSADTTGMCFPDGKLVSYTCAYEYLMPGTTLSTVWRSNLFDCPDRVNDLEMNQLYFAYGGDCSLATTTCSVFNATQTISSPDCEAGEPVNLTSTLTFIANHTLHNGATITCGSFAIGGPTYRCVLVEIGVEPPPPATANITFPLRDVCQYDWEEPEAPVTGGIRGYNLTYSGNCGTCTPNGLVSNMTFRSMCSGFEVNGQNCTFEVRTVTDDCGFYSIPAEVKSNLDNTKPTDVVVTILCSENADFPTIHVEWDFFIPIVDNGTVLPGVLGFRVIILDDSSNSYPLEFLPDPSRRSYEFNTTVLETAGLPSDSHFIVVEVETQVSNQSSNSSSMFSVQRTMTDPSSTLTPDQCINISINPYCNESADSFQAQLQLTEGECGESGQSTNNTQSLSANYIACIFVEVGTVCYSAIVLRNEAVVGRTSLQQLVLQACNTTNLPMPPGLMYNSSMGPVSPNEEVAHNSILDVLCEVRCTLNGLNRQTQCVNGTFEPFLDSNTTCTCPKDLTPGEIAGISVGVVFIIIIITIIIIIIVLYFANKHSCSRNDGSSKQVYSDEGQELKEVENSK